MFKKQCMKFGSTILLLFAALIVGGCATTTKAIYTPTLEDTRDLSPAQARELLVKTVQASLWCSKLVSVTYEKIRVTCPLSAVDKVGTLRFAENPAVAATLSTMDASSITACTFAGGVKGSCMFLWDGDDKSSFSNARDFVRALYVLAHTSGVDPAQEAAFERAAQNYRNAQVKPQLPEEAVKYKVQAELAVQQKRFDDAVDLYDQALGVAPWWPAGHYNRGLILGELQDYQEGIRSLQRYLKLEPDASNARAVQLRIYQWESLVPGAARS